MNRIRFAAFAAGTMTTRTHLTRLAVAAALAALGSTTVPLLSPAPAQASTTRDGCTVTPQRPTAYGTANKTARFRVTVTCAAGRTIQIQQRAYARYANNFSKIYLYRDFVMGFPWAETRTETKILTIGNLRPYGPESAYHDVRFTVKKDGRWSAWTEREKSPTGYLPW